MEEFDQTHLVERSNFMKRCTILIAALLQISAAIAQSRYSVEKILIPASAASAPTPSIVGSASTTFQSLGDDESVGVELRSFEATTDVSSNLGIVRNGTWKQLASGSFGYHREGYLGIDKSVSEDKVLFSNFYCYFRNCSRTRYIAELNGDRYVTSIVDSSEAAAQVLKATRILDTNFVGNLLITGRLKEAKTAAARKIQRTFLSGKDESVLLPRGFQGISVSDSGEVVTGYVVKNITFKKECSNKPAQLTSIVN